MSSKEQTSESESSDISENYEETDSDLELLALSEKHENGKTDDSFISETESLMLNKNLTLDSDTEKEIIILPSELRRTDDKLHKAEWTRVLSERAAQIENGAIVFVPIENETDAHAIARKEIFAKKCPLKIRRFITSVIVEEWSVNELAPPFDLGPSD